MSVYAYKANDPTYIIISKTETIIKPTPRGLAAIAKTDIDRICGVNSVINKDVDPIPANNPIKVVAQFISPELAKDVIRPINNEASSVTNRGAPINKKASEINKEVTIQVFDDGQHE